MSYPTLPWVQGAKFCNNVLGNFIISAPHMALMTELQTLSCINILKKYYLHKPSHFSAVQQDLRRWVIDKIVLMTMAGHMSPETPGTGPQWSPVVRGDIGAGGASDQISLLSLRHCCLPLLVGWWPVTNQRPGLPGSDQSEARIVVTRSLCSIGPRVPGDRGFINSGQHNSREYCYHDEWPGSQWIMDKLLYHRIIMTQ